MAITAFATLLSAKDATGTGTLRPETTSTSRPCFIGPQDSARLILAKLGYTDGTFDLINPKTSTSYSPDAIPYSDIKEGDTLQVQLSKINSPPG